MYIISWSSAFTEAGLNIYINYPSTVNDKTKLSTKSKNNTFQCTTYHDGVYRAGK